jgi:hypothetical protein
MDSSLSGLSQIGPQEMLVLPSVSKEAYWNPLVLFPRLIRHMVRIYRFNKSIDLISPPVAPAA